MNSIKFNHWYIDSTWHDTIIKPLTIINGNIFCKIKILTKSNMIFKNCKELSQARKYWPTMGIHKVCKYCKYRNRTSYICFPFDIFLKNAEPLDKIKYYLLYKNKFKIGI